jgi:hypothetical protein
VEWPYGVAWLARTSDLLKQALDIAKPINMILLRTLREGPMQIHQALDRISEIHQQVARGEVYRGYRSLPAALTGILALAAALVQPLAIGVDPSPIAYVAFWVAVAPLGFLTCGGEIILAFVKESDSRARKRTRIVASQFVPCLVAGTLITATIVMSFPSAIALLPGIWAVLYGLGTFSVRPYLPRRSGWVALFFIVCGGAMLSMAESGASLSPWGMGLTFGVGQFLTALILYWDLERENVT